jgi:hypothetical protein
MRMLEECEALIFPDDSAFFVDGRPLLGAGCFRDTVVVLGFRRGTLWVRNAGP